MRSLWAAGLLLRRLRAEGAIALLIVVLICGTSFVFAAAPRLFNVVADDALRHSALVAPAAQRDLALTLVSTLTPGADGGVTAVRDHGDLLTRQYPPSVTALISDRSLRLTTVRLYVADPPLIETHVSLQYQDGLTEATRIVAGRWPVDQGIPLLQVPADGGPEGDPVILEVAFSAAQANLIGVELGGHLSVTLDGTDPLVRDTAFRIGPTELAVVGIYEPTDPEAAYWSTAASLREASVQGSEDSQIIFATAYVPAEMYPSLWSSQLPFHYEWRLRVDPERLDVDKVEQLQVDLRRLGFAGTAGAEAEGTVSITTGLPRILDGFAAERDLTQSILSIATIGPFGLAAGALGMVALLLVHRRRAALALTRGRGASGALVLGTQLWEAILLAGGASLVGLLLAMAVVPARASPASASLAIAVAVAATLVLVGASWPAAMRPLGLLEREDAPVLRVAPRRLVLELTIVVVAVAATLLLRQRGLSVGEDDAADGAAGVDPLLASVPILSGVAAGIVAMRLYPLPIRALGWLAARRRDIVPVLGLRSIGRRPAGANLTLLVLLLTAAFGAFSSTIAASLDRGQLVASYLAVGADYRLERIGGGALGPSLDPAAIPGVEAVAAGLFDRSAPFATTSSQRAVIYLEAIDPAGYAQVVAGTPGDPGLPGALFAPPEGAGIGTAENPIPAILSELLPVGSANLGPGDQFRATLAGQSLTFQVVERRAAFPGLDARAGFSIVPYSWVRAAFGDRPPPPSILWLRATGDAAGPLGEAATEAGSVRLVSRYQALAALRGSPLAALIPTGYGVAVVLAATYMAFTIIGALVLSAGRRTRDLAYLRTLGVTASESLGLTLFEHAPPVLVALVPGVALGIGVAILVEPGLGLATFVGASGVPLFVDWPVLLTMVGALIGVVALAVVGGTWLSRRARFVDAMRLGDE